MMQPACKNYDSTVFDGLRMLIHKETDSVITTARELIVSCLECDEYKKDRCNKTITLANTLDSNKIVNEL